MKTAVVLPLIAVLAVNGAKLRPSQTPDIVLPADTVKPIIDRFPVNPPRITDSHPLIKDPSIPPHKYDIVIDDGPEIIFPRKPILIKDPVNTEFFATPTKDPINPPRIIVDPPRIPVVPGHPIIYDPPRVPVHPIIVDPPRLPVVPGHPIIYDPPRVPLDKIEELELFDEVNEEEVVNEEEPRIVCHMPAIRDPVPEMVIDYFPPIEEPEMVIDPAPIQEPEMVIDPVYEEEFHYAIDPIYEPEMVIDDPIYIPPPFAGELVLQDDPEFAVADDEVVTF